MKEHFKEKIMDILGVEELYEYEEKIPGNAVHIEIHDMSTSFGITYAMLEQISQLLRTKEISFESNDSTCSEVTPDLWRRVLINVTGVRFPVEVNAGTKRVILDTIHDLTADFLSSDRMADKGLPLGAIEEAVKQGIITVPDMITEFCRQLHDRLGIER